MIISKRLEDNFLAIISPTITPPLGIPNTMLSFLSCSFFITSFNASARMFAAAALSLSFNWNLLLILSNMNLSPTMVDLYLDCILREISLQ
jgi:hypothetical protein